jgi:SAM-dependent methyltransferase
VLLGVDIDEDNVEWCKSFLKNADFMKGPLLPTLDIESDSLDYIVATSVFTHLKEDTIELWLEELRRVLKPGGYAALTVASDSRVAWNLRDAQWIKELQQKGVDDSIVSNDLDGHVENGYYRNVKVTKKYIREKWGKFFTVHDVLPHVFGYQDVVVCEKNG